MSMQQIIVFIMSVKCQKNAHYDFPKPTVMSSNFFLSNFY